MFSCPPNPTKQKEAQRLFPYPRQEGASSLFSSEMRKDGGNMDERKPKAVIRKKILPIPKRRDLQRRGVWNIEIDFYY